MMRYATTSLSVAAGLLVAVALGGCAQHVEPIDLHDQTIPIEARRLVADAQDSIDIARAKLGEARREKTKTVEWKRDLLGRDWPSSASSALSRLRELASARTELAELKVARAEENVEFARAKYRLITAKTAIRHDLAIYELEPLRRRVRQESKDVEKLDGEILSKRQNIAQLSNSWWDSYAQLARKGSKTRAFFVSAAEKLPSPELRAPASQEGGGDEDGTSEKGN